MKSHSKNPPPTHGKTSSPLPGKFIQGLLFFSSPTLAILIWRVIGECWDQNNQLKPLLWSGLLILTAGFGIVTTLGLRRVKKLENAHAYRAAFFTGLGLISIRWVILSVTEGYSLSPVHYILLTLSLFTGGLVVSGFQYGIVENTFPPSEEIKRKVEEKYRHHNPTPPPTHQYKRVFDFTLAFFGILISTPMWVLISLLIWLHDPGQIFFIKNCAGYRGINFPLLKFRTMEMEAEKETGPIASDTPDQRVNRIGKLLRRTALDELPQLVNILRGEMSFVGPRPLRTVVEAEYLKEIHGYAGRYDMLPGLSGLAQIAGDYYLPSRDKLRYELIYAKNASLFFDIKLIFLAFVLVFWLHWKKDWDGRVQRSWIKWDCKPQKR